MRVFHNYSTLSNYSAGNLPGSEKAAAQALSLPVYPELTEKEQCRIIKTIKNFYSK